MPELPEVETIRRGLEPALSGARLERVLQRRPDLRFPLPDRFAERLTGAQVKRLGRRAKYLLAELDQGETWVTHLGMTGRFTVEKELAGRFAHAAPAAPAHEHLVFWTDRGVRIGFCDARRFGYMALVASDALETHPWFAGLGPEPLGNSFSAAHLEAEFDGRIQNVKATLLDQRVVAGLGNIYVCEALFRSKISPLTPAGQVGRAALDRLAGAVREVLGEAIEAGGSTLRDYADANGGQGYFQHSFRVYGRQGEACSRPRCGGVVERTVQAGRSTFFCPKCQR
jgi:formamidopyrimidine-DNA glycosylase